MSNEDNRTNLALTSGEQELRLVVETIPALVWRAGPDGNFDYVNKRMLEYMGAPFGENHWLGVDGKSPPGRHRI